MKFKKQLKDHIDICRTVSTVGINNVRIGILKKLRLVQLIGNAIPVKNFNLRVG